ncbi:hypothetical protein MDAP_002040 [Mitosporidium daphniae]
MVFNPKDSEPLVTPIDLPDSKARARNTYILEYSWEDCIEAYMRRFPKHPRITVMADSFILSEEKDEYKERTIRRCLLNIDVPQAIKKAFSLSTFNFIQEMLLDRKKRSFRLNTTNEFLIGRLEIHENVIMEPWNMEKQVVDYQNGKYCRFYQRATLKLPGLVPFSGQIEKIAMKNYQRNMSKGKYIDTKFILEMLAERKGISLNLSRYKKKFQVNMLLRSTPAVILLILIAVTDHFLFEYLSLYSFSIISVLLVFIFTFFIDVIEPILAIYSSKFKQAVPGASGMMIAAALADSSAISPKLLEADGFRKDIFNLLCKHLHGQSSDGELSAGLVRLTQLSNEQSDTKKTNTFSIKVPFSRSVAVYKSRVPPPPPVNHFPPKLLNLLVIKIEDGDSTLWVTKSIRSFIHFWSKVKYILKRSPDDGTDFLTEFNISNWKYSTLETFDIFLHKDFMTSQTKQFQLEYARVFADGLLSKFAHDLISVLHEPQLQRKLTRKLFSFLCIDDEIITTRPPSFDLGSMRLKASHERGSSFPRSLPIAGVISLATTTRLWREWFFSFAESIPFLFLSAAQEAGRFSIELAIPLGGTTISAYKIIHSELDQIFPGGIFQVLYSCKLDISSSTLNSGINSNGTTCQLVIGFKKSSCADAWMSGFTSLGGKFHRDGFSNSEKRLSKSPICDLFRPYPSEDEKKDDESGVCSFPPYILGKPFRMAVVINRPKNPYFTPPNKRSLNPVLLSAELLNSLILMLGGQSQLPKIFTELNIPDSDHSDDADADNGTSANSDSMHIYADKNFSDSTTSAPDSADNIIDKDASERQKAKEKFFKSLSLLRHIDLISFYNPSGMISQFMWNSKEKISFWVNIFFTLLLHQQFILASSSIRCAYDIGGFIFSQSDIRSCLLKRHRYLVNPNNCQKVSAHDPRHWLVSISDDDPIDSLFLVLLSPLHITPECPLVLIFEGLSDEEFLTRLHLIASRALEPRILPKFPHSPSSQVVEIDNSLLPYFKYIEDTALSSYSSAKWHKKVFFKRLLSFMPLSMVDKLLECHILKRKTKSKRRLKWNRPISILTYFSGSSTADQSHSVNSERSHNTTSRFSDPNVQPEYPQTAPLVLSPNDHSDAESSQYSESSSLNGPTPNIRISVSSKTKISFTDLELDSRPLHERIRSQ